MVHTCMHVVLPAMFGSINMYMCSRLEAALYKLSDSFVTDYKIKSFYYMLE